LKIQEILAKKWALLRASPNGLWAVFAGFLCIFKFTGSAAPRLGGLTRFIERTFCVDKNIFWRLSLKGFESELGYIESDFLQEGLNRFRNFENSIVSGDDVSIEFETNLDGVEIFDVPFYSG
jgi:hypothetical protein